MTFCNLIVADGPTSRSAWALARWATAQIVADGPCIFTAILHFVTWLLQVDLQAIRAEHQRDERLHRLLQTDLAYLLQYDILLLDCCRWTYKPFGLSISEMSDCTDFCRRILHIYCNMTFCYLIVAGGPTSHSGWASARWATAQIVADGPCIFTAILHFVTWLLHMDLQAVRPKH